MIYLTKQGKEQSLHAINTRLCLYNGDLISSMVSFMLKAGLLQPV